MWSGAVSGGAESSAPAYLFHCSDAHRQQDIVRAVKEGFAGLSDENLLAELKTLEKKTETIRVREMPVEPGIAWSPYEGKKVELSCRVFSGKIDHSWRISSFSSLVSGSHHASETADHDPLLFSEPPDQMLPEQPGVHEPPLTIFSFPRGAKTGTFLHDVLEHLDFAQENRRSMEKLIADKLAEYGFEEIWSETLCNTIEKVLAVPLDPRRKDFTLSRIGRRERLNELEFYFPLKSISPGALRDLFWEHPDIQATPDFPECIERLDFSPVKGFMKGYIDMVFRFEDRYYLVDWKTNFLGGSIDDYGRESLAETMKSNFYYLQYYVYTVALHQYLKLRLSGYTYERHFGGVYYIFCRGVDPERGLEFGVYRDKPPAGLIHELSANLIP